MTNRTLNERIAGWCARHPWRVIVAWTIVLALLGGFAARDLSGVLSNTMTMTADNESIHAWNLLKGSTLHNSNSVSETIVVTSKDGTTVDDPTFQAHTTEVVKAVRTQQGAWKGEGPTAPPNPLKLQSGGLTDSYVLAYYEMARFNRPEIEQLVSKDRTALIIPVFIDFSKGEPSISDYTKEVEKFDNDRFDVTTIGNASINTQFQDVVLEDLLKAETVGIPIAILVLVIVFGALMAPALPFVLAVYAVGIALGFVTIFGKFQDLQLFIQNMVTMLGLAVGIDYSLFILERYREQRAHGFDKFRSIEIAGGTAGKAVLFSGLTVMLSLVGVMLVKLNIFYSLGLGAVLVVAVAMALTSTLLPAMLGLLGDRINWPRRNYHASTDVTVRNMYEGFWGKTTHLVVRRPWISLIASVVFLLVLATPALGIRTGFTSSAQMPPGETTDAYHTLESRFSAGLLSPVEFVIEGEHTKELDQAISQFQKDLQGTGDFVMLTQPRWDDDKGLAYFSGTMSYASSSDRGYERIRQIRSDIAPATVEQPTGATVYTTGQASFEVDMIKLLDRDMPLVFAFVLGLSFILLMFAFRSVIVPLQAILYNLLSVGATYGLMNLVFAKGWMRDFLNYNASPVIEAWLPILLFCVLFGLSMDYHVFLLSRIREHYDHSRNNGESVAVGLRTTGKIITGAAAIMVVIFGAFSQGSMLSLQQLGFGLAVAVFLDATIVRSILVPAVMTIVGERNWWLPSWLSWLPDLRIEGNAPDDASAE